MATKKTRKRPYTPPPSETVSKKQTGERRTVRVERSSRADRFYTLPNGRRMPIPPQPTFRRLMRQLPFYFVAMLLVGYFTIPFEGNVSTQQKWSIAAIQAAPITMLMLPVLYLLDRARWNRYLRLTTNKSTSAS